jgi:dTDP-4-amino-4,6-dideoxygalactose transaminase
MRKNNVYLGDWYTTPIAPKEVNIGLVGYKQGMCFNSEFVCERVVNLPTHINISEAGAGVIVGLIKDFYANKENNR